MFNPVKTNRYEELDALRGIAVLMVVFFHYTMGRPEANWGFKLGITGVELFFMISGFVIIISIGRVTQGIDFVINRASRLYPTYWAAVTFTFTLMILQHLFHHPYSSSVRWVDYLANMTMFQHYLQVPNLDGPYWTLIIEMNFYAGVLILFYLSWLKHVNTISIIVCILTVLTVHFLWNNFSIFVFKVLPLLNFFPLFFAGILFYRISTDRRNQVRDYCLILLCLLCQLLLFHRGRANGFISHVEYAMMLTTFFGSFVLFVNGKLGFIVNRSTLFMGKISYALYLTHQFLSLNVIIPFLTKTLHINFWVASLLVALPIAVAIASLFTFAIEIPYSRVMRQRFHRVVARKL